MVKILSADRQDQLKTFAGNDILLRLDDSRSFFFFWAKTGIF